MVTIKQKPRSKNCLACVAAMATKTSIGEYDKFCLENDLKFSDDLTFVRYLWENGYMVGLYFGDDDGNSRVKIRDLGLIDIWKGQ